MSNDQFAGQPAAESQPSAETPNPWVQNSATEQTTPWGANAGQPMSAPSAAEYSGPIPQQQQWGQQGAEPTTQIPMMGGYQQQYAAQQPAKPSPFDAFKDMGFETVKTPQIAKFTWLMIVIGAGWAWLVRVLGYFAHLKTYTYSGDSDINIWKLLGGIGELLIGATVMLAVIFGSRMVIEYLVSWHKKQGN